MSRLVRRARFFCITIVLGAVIASAQNANPDLATAYQEAMAAFQSGQYAQAATALEALVARVAVSPQVEPIFYTIGSAYFNAGDYVKAIAAFKNYRIKFPQGPHATRAAFAIAQSNLLSENFKEAATQMAAFEKDPQLRDEALLFEAEAFQSAGNIDQAMAALEKAVGEEIQNAGVMRAAMELAQLYAKKGDGAQALHVLEKIHRKIALADDVIELNTLSVELGDKFFNSQQFKEALTCYRFVYSREEVIKLESDRIDGLQQKVEANLAETRAHPSKITQLAASNAQLQEDMTHAKERLNDFAKRPSLTPAIYLRLGRCFFELDRKWEAVVVDLEILDRFKEGPEREPALFGLIVALADVNQPQRASVRCEQYLRDFAEDSNAETVGYLSGAIALQAGDTKKAENLFDRILSNQPKSKFREQIRYLLGNTSFMAGDYDEAVARYQDYLKEFPRGSSAEEVKYRITLAALFAGNYADAMSQLQAYITKNPRSNFLPDAKYRLAVCQYAASLYDDVIAACQAWEKEFPGNPQLGEVLALLGDADAASSRESAAIPIYIRSYQTATTEEVLNYSLFAANKLLQKQGRWDKIADLFTGFIKDKPDSPTVISAIYWVGKARAHEGRIDEARQLTAGTIRKYIDDPNRDSVEQLITQLAQLCVKKTKPAAESHRTSAAQNSVAPEAELDRLLSSAAPILSPTAKARLLFAKAELARLRRQPVDDGKYLAQIAREVKPGDLSPLLLGEVADYLLSQQKPEQAAEFYQRLLDAYPKSSMVDYAYHGLGEIAFRKKEYQKALRYFRDGLEKITATQKLKDLSVGSAKTLLALGRLDEAQKSFEQVASVREWRGEATAYSVYSLGQIAAQRGRWAEANAYFQRVYVGYQKFLPWVAKAYIGSGESFEKLGQKQEATNTYRELLRNEKLSQFSEANEARMRLEILDQGS
ncbi:MAG: tetratricopeptide repeat protein [Chthoniobacterales bacterium]